MSDVDGLISIVNGMLELPISPIIFLESLATSNARQLFKENHVVIKKLNF